MSDAIVKTLEGLSPNNRRRLTSAIQYIATQLDRGYYGDLTIHLVVEDGNIQSVKKTKSENDK